MNKNIHFSSITNHWSTPKSIYQLLDNEFHFDYDPCPLHGSGGLESNWGKSTFCNPPYSSLRQWLQKGYFESLQCKTIVFLIPSRTDTRAWHDFVMRAKEIRFIKGRLKFGEAKNSAPFPSCVVIF